MTDNPQVVHHGHTLVNNPVFWEAVNTHFPDFPRIKEMIAEAYRAETGRDEPTQRELSLDPPMILKAGSRSPRSDPHCPFQEAALTRCSRQQRQSGR